MFKNQTFEEELGFGITEIEQIFEGYCPSTTFMVR